MRWKTVRCCKWLAVCSLGYFAYLLSSSLRTEAPGNVSAKGLVSDYLILTDKKGFYANIERKSSKFRNHTVKPAVRRLQDIPRVIEYCNSPLEPVTGSEGDAPEGFRLRMVHIFLRHGDRTPHHEFPGYYPEQINCFVDQNLLNKDEKLKEYILTMKKFTGKQPHGNFFRNWAIFPNRSICDSSVLTGFGAIQHMNIGKYLHDRYITENSLFNRRVALTSQIYIRSTVSSRTYQSAIAFLYGFLPLSAFNLTNLNIDNNSDTSFCSMIHSRQKSCYCSYAKILHQQVHNLRKNFVKTNDKGQQLLKSIRNTFGFDSDRTASFMVLMDIFSLSVCHNLGNPCLAYDNTRCLTASQYEQIWNSLDEEGKYLTLDRQKTFTEYANIILHPVMIEIARRLKDEAERGHKHKMIIYSGHDVTLSPLLHFLGLDDGRWVRYAARVVIEMYEAKSKKDKNKHYLRFLYNGKDLTQDVIFCKGKLHKGLCKFKLFYDYVFTEMLQQFRYTSYYDACSRKR